MEVELYFILKLLFGLNRVNLVMNEMMFEDYDYEDVEVEYADYYEDDTYVMPDEESWKDDSEEQTVDPFTLEELYNYCIIPTINRFP
ncbi:hypothetical protein Avbf_00940 [Armadillidium vulgare]|nr:hypothetical protein Avbf_00940 [Armadillidium vulgare]